MPPIIRTGILAIIAAAYPLLIHLIRKSFRCIAISKCSQKRNTLTVISAVWMISVHISFKMWRKQKMTEIIVDYFDLEQICESGQCFRMKRKSEHQYEVIA